MMMGKAKKRGRKSDDHLSRPTTRPDLPKKKVMMPHGQNIENEKLRRKLMMVNPGSSSNSSAISLLRALREAYEAFQKEGNDLEALNCLKEACGVKAELFGPRNKLTLGTELDYVKCSNIIASKLLRKGDLETSCSLLLDAHESSCRDSRAETATLINISVCMYSQELIEDSLKYLEMVEVTKHFMGELHLNLCAVWFKLGDFAKALFHAQTSVRFGQQELKKCFGLDLPSCFKQEALVLLALSYHALAICLRMDCLENMDLTSTEIEPQDEQISGLMGLLTGIKWHIKAYEDIALPYSWAVPSSLCESLWNSFVVACADCAPLAQDALARNVFCHRPDMEFLCKVVLEQMNATKIQKHIRTYLLRREDKAARQIQKRTKQYLQECTENRARKIQAVFRCHTQRKRYLDMKFKATRAQKILRGRQARLRYAQLRTETLKAVQPIQANARGWLARKRVGKLREAKQASSLVEQEMHHNQYQKKTRIQENHPTLFERLSPNRLFHSEEESISPTKKATIVLQKTARGWFARKKMSKKKQKKTKESPRVPLDPEDRTVRQELLMRRTIARWKHCDDIRKYQAFYMLKEIGSDMMSEVAAIEKVQQMQYHLQIREKETIENQHHLVEENQAVKLIQARWRGHVISKDFEQLRGVAILIQREYRRYAERKAAKFAEVVHTIMISFRVAIIQNRWRDYCARRKHKAAATIQRKARGRLARSRTQALQREIVAATQIQKHVRGFSVRNFIRKSEEGFDKSVVKIQSLIRGKQTRSKLFQHKQQR